MQLIYILYRTYTFKHIKAPHLARRIYMT